MALKRCTVCGVEFDAKGNAKTCSAECRKKRLAEAKRKRRQKPEYKKREAEADRKRRQKPENKKRKAEADRKRRQKPENKKRQAEADRKWRQKPEYKKRKAESLRKWREKRSRAAFERELLLFSIKVQELKRCAKSPTKRVRGKKKGAC